MHFVALAIETSMRRSELLGLQWSNVNIDRRIAFLPVTKNGESRGVPLSSRAIEILRGLPSSRDGGVFGDLTQDALKQSFKRAARRAGIKDLHLHDLRHYLPSLTMSDGARPRFGATAELPIAAHGCLAGHPT